MIEVYYTTEEATMMFPMWMPIVMLLMFFVIGVFIIGLSINRQNRKMVKGMLLCEFLTAAGKSYKILLPYKGQTVIKEKKYPDSVKGHKKDQRGTIIYGVREDAIYDSWYPEGGLLSVLGCAVGKVYYHEGNPEPAFKRGAEPVMSPEFIGYLRDENTAELAFEATARIKELEDKISEMLSAKVVYIFLAAILAVSGIGMYVTYTGIDALKAALGVQ